MAQPGSRTPAVITKTDCSRTTAISPDWQSRFVEAYNIELQDWVDRTRMGQEPGGASAWDGYMVCLTANVLGQCREEGGTAKEIKLPEKPDFYR